MKISTIIISLFFLHPLPQVHCMENTENSQRPNAVSLLPISSDANMLIWEATELTPLELNQFRLESRGIDSDIRKLFNQKRYREKYPHYTWFYDEDMAQYFPMVKSGNKTISQLIIKYRSSLEKIIFAEGLSDDNKLLKLNELNELFFYNSKLVLSLKDKINSKKSSDAKLSMILSLFYTMNNVSNNILKNALDINLIYSAANFVEIVKYTIVSNILASAEINFMTNNWDNIEVNVRANVKTIVSTNISTNVSTNVFSNIKRLLHYNLDHINFTSEHWDEELNIAQRTPVFYAISEYLYASLLYLEDKKISENLEKANLKVFEKYQFTANKNMLSKIVKPCNDYLNFHKVSRGFDDEFKSFLAREIYEEERFLYYSFNPIIGVICNILSEENELVRM